MTIQDSTIIKSEAKPVGKKPKSFNDKPFQKSNPNKFNAKKQNSFGGKSGTSRSGGKSFSSGGARGR